MYEYFAGGLGWSELSWFPPISQPDEVKKVGICSETDFSRQLCFIDNDPLEQATAERAGCVQAHRQWYHRSGVTECRTVPGGNPGHIWCCPENAPRPIPTTPDQRARATELIVAEQQARDEGRLTTTTSADTAKAPTIEPGQTEPVSTQETYNISLEKFQQDPKPVLVVVAAVLALGAGGYLAFRYFTRLRSRRVRRAAALARVR